VVELVATTEAVPDTVSDVEEEPTASAPVVLTDTPVKTLRLFTEMLMGVTTRAIDALCDCPPWFPVTVMVKIDEGVLAVVNTVSTAALDPPDETVTVVELSFILGLPAKSGETVVPSAMLPAKLLMLVRTIVDVAEDPVVKLRLAGPADTLKPDAKTTTAAGTISAPLVPVTVTA